MRQVSSQKSITSAVKRVNFTGFLPMDNKEETRTCGQCHKDVAETNFALHESHCSRFLCPCPDCGERVPRDQLDQHREDQHTQVRCLKCNKKMERGQLTDHESDECVERPQSCEFCELELPWKELDGHSLVCGSRTELCRDCGRYVTLRDLPAHGSTCSATNNGSDPPQTTSKLPPDTVFTENITVYCSRCSAPFPAEDLEEHELVCVPATDLYNEESEEEVSEDEEDFYRQGAASLLSRTFKATYLSERASSGPSGDGGDPNQISTCPHCHLALPVLTLRWHQVKCQVHISLK